MIKWNVLIFDFFLSQGMSLATLSGWTSPGKGTIRVTITPGDSLTLWTRNTCVTFSSTLLTGT